MVSMEKYTGKFVFQYMYGYMSYIINVRFFVAYGGMCINVWSCGLIPIDIIVHTTSIILTIRQTLRILFVYSDLDETNLCW